MSDPVSNADIEDVLSSIRRLVSEDPATRRRDTAPAPAAKVERLVLTPAFRVSGRQDSAAQDADHTPEAETADAPAPEAAAHAETAAAPAPEPETGEDQDAADILVMPTAPPQIDAGYEASSDWREDTPPAPEAHISSDVVRAWAAEQGEDDAADDPEPEPEPAGAGDTAQTLKQRIAGLEAAMDIGAQDWEPDGSEDGESDLTRPISLDAGDDGAALAAAMSKVAVDKGADTAGPGIAAKDEEDAAPDPAPESQPADRPEEPQAMRDAGQVHFEAAEDAAGDADIAAVHEDEEIAAVDEDRNAFADDEEPVMLDEETLREMVADIVREELQGVLGERITRNVRRLIRREIQRAMALRDLE